MPICRWLFRQAVRIARTLALDNAGSKSAARIPMMAMTTSSSIKVNARRELMGHKTPQIQIRYNVFPAPS